MLIPKPCVAMAQSDTTTNTTKQSKHAIPKQAAAVALLAGGTPRGLTPENRPFLSSYVLMSVRRSKFEYILTLGWKNRGMERLSWSKYSWNRAWIVNLTHRIFSRERPETKTIWADGACCELLFHADLERNRAEIQRTEWWRGKQGENETNEFQLQLHSLCVQPHANCLETQSLYLSLVQHFQLEIVKVI